MPIAEAIEIAMLHRPMSSCVVDTRGLQQEVRNGAVHERDQDVFALEASHKATISDNFDDGQCCKIQLIHQGYFVFSLSL